MDWAGAGGCAAKIDSQILDSILMGVQIPVGLPEAIVGLDDRDDAAVLRLAGSPDLVTTVDFIPPVVPDPYKWGWIAAANAISDIYAMGGNPHFALSMLGIPLQLSYAASSTIQGAVDCLSRSASFLVGGHTIQSSSPFFGLSVTGSVPHEGIWRKRGALVGDALVLSRPLGTGVVLSALKAQIIDELPSEVDACLLQTNALAAEVLHGFEVHAATDVTGFGLALQVADIARASAVSAEIYVESVPLLVDALPFVKDGVATSLTGDNRRAVTDNGIADGIPMDVPEVSLLFDPQTNGGLLVAMPEEDAVQAVRQLRDSGLLFASVIGHCVARRSYPLILR